MLSFWSIFMILFIFLEVMGAILSVLIIWVLTGVLVYQAIERILSGEHKINADIMLIVAASGVGVNIVLVRVIYPCYVFAWTQFESNKKISCQLPSTHLCHCSIFSLAWVWCWVTVTLMGGVPPMAPMVTLIVREPYPVRLVWKNRPRTRMWMFALHLFMWLEIFFRA